MTKSARIQIVEDEAIIAMDVQARLMKLGYTVSAVCGTGEDAVWKAMSDRPDLILMDINLKGGIDGIQAAQQIHKEYDLPVVFLTAYGDEKTLARAKVTEPYAYLLKPCNDRDLRIAIEISLYKFDADRKLKRLERWLSTTLNSLGDGVIATDVDGRINFMNPVAEKTTGWTWTEAHGRQLADVFVALDEKTREPISDPVRRAIAGGIAVMFESRTILVRKDGTEIAIDDTCAPTRSDKGTPTGAVIVFRDISRERVLEAESMRVRERAMQDEKMASIGRLAGGIAHDFNNLMSVVIGQSELLLREMEKDPRAVRAETIRDAGHKAASVSRKMLAFSRQQPVSPKHTDMNDIVSGMERLLTAMLMPAVTLEIDMVDDALPVFVDSTQITQVILNFAVNARDAMPNGGVLKVSTSTLEIRAGEEKSYGDMEAGPVVCLTVADTGTGIPPDVLPHIFEPFFTNKQPGKGTGLGLAMANGFVRQSHGSIAVETTPGKGTAFRVYLPRSEAESVSAPSSSFMEAAAIGGTETILAVDDEEGIRNLFTDVLEGSGYKVLLAGSAEEALEILRSNSETIHVLLTDIQLPARNGLELWQEAVKLRPSLRVLFSAGTTRESVLTLYPQFPTNGVLLEKPMHINEILRRVREVLR